MRNAQPSRMGTIVSGACRVYFSNGTHLSTGFCISLYGGDVFRLLIADEETTVEVQNISIRIGMTS